MFSFFSLFFMIFIICTFFYIFNFRTFQSGLQVTEKLPDYVHVFINTEIMVNSCFIFSDHAVSINSFLDLCQDNQVCNWYQEYSPISICINTITPPPHLNIKSRSVISNYINIDTMRFCVYKDRIII